MLEQLSVIFTRGNLRYLGTGLLITIAVSLACTVTSGVFGVGLALLRENKFLRLFVNACVKIFVTTPLLMWIVLFAFALPFGNIYIRCAVALLLYNTGVCTEMFSGSISNTSVHIKNNALSQGFSDRQILFHITLPTALRNSVSTLFQRFSAILKDTALLAYVGIVEFFYRAKMLFLSGSRISFHAVTDTGFIVLFLFVAGCYLLLRFAIIKISELFEV